MHKHIHHSLHYDSQAFPDNVQKRPVNLIELKIVTYGII